MNKNIFRILREQQTLVNLLITIMLVLLAWRIFMMGYHQGYIVGHRETVAAYTALKELRNGNAE